VIHNCELASAIIKELTTNAIIHQSIHDVDYNYWEQSGYAINRRPFILQWLKDQNSKQLIKIDIAPEKTKGSICPERRLREKSINSKS
jgi:hypothetical protein